MFNVKIELCLSVLVDADDEAITVSRSCNVGTRPKVEFASVCEYNYFKWFIIKKCFLNKINFETSIQKFVNLFEFSKQIF